MVSRPGVPHIGMLRVPEVKKALLEAYPNAKLADQSILDEDRLIQFLGDCDSVIVGMEPITDKVLAALPNVKVIGKFGIGCDSVDFDAVRRHGVRFGYTPGVNKLVVAELTLCFMIAGLRELIPLNQSLRSGQWKHSITGRQLSGRTVGIHGCGNIGKEVIRLLRPFGCEILACDIADYPDFYREYGVTPVSFDKLLERSEILSLHLPRTQATLGLYGDDVLAKLRLDCVLINTCRGKVVDDEALYHRLKDGRIAAACFDVLASEPPSDYRLIQLPNFLASPHIAGTAADAWRDMGLAAIRHLEENALVAEGRTF